ncbi:MAG: hypothetical protein JWO38_752 [Gemmataceae bacterium]|nr:hypothetical protein [Gemmataceae bacterium]
MAYVSVKYQEEPRAYRSTAEVMSDEDLRRQAIEDAIRQIDGWKARFSHLQELADVFKAVDRAKRRLAS